MTDGTNSTGAASTGSWALEALGIRKRFGGVIALDGVDVRLPAGQVTGLVGANGSGKSTFVDCITGFLAPDAGTIALAGSDLTRASRRRRALAGLRRTFQAVHAYEGMTALEQVEVAQQETDGTGWWDAVLRTPRLRSAQAAAIERAEHELERVGLVEKRHEQADALSYGQQKLLGLACGLVTDPTVLCLDEPLAGVSPRQTDLLVEVLDGLRAEHRTLLVIEHNMDFVAHMSDHVVVFAQGAVAAAGGVEVLQDDRVFEALMGMGVTA
ncbi:ABC transporter ATP-binding protein [Agromyces sp. SYSU T00194]|uniref:ABC transporter ATP-binding protein n=1 Tax=Agromyces chitinivorans TaxID=3158560 RepID=UPI003396287D